MEITLEMYQHARALMTCATAHVCIREESCFHLAEPIVREYEAKEHSAALARTEKKDEVEHYAPRFPPNVAWEWARPDWDAA